MLKPLYSWLLLVNFFVLSTTANAFPAVDSHSCGKLRGNSQPFMLVLKTGEELPEAIVRCATDANLKGASISGLGAIENPTLAYYLLDSHKYKTKTFSGLYEVTSLNGNIQQLENKPFVHMHVTLGDIHYQSLSGHLMKARVGATAEITIIPFKGPLIRKMDSSAGTQLISTE